MENSRVLEINGIKMEVDMRTARRIDEFKVGDNVKILKKEYSDSYKVYSGVIVEFVNFKELPTIIIAIFVNDYYSGASIEFINFNKETEGIEMTLASEHELTLEKSRIVDKFNNEIEKKKDEVSELINKKEYFLKHFHKYFKEEE